MAIGGLLAVSEALQTIWDGSNLGAGYKIYTYEAGTSTPLATYPTYTDSVNQTNANTNPTVADSDGRVTMWGSGTTAYKVVVKTAADVEVKTIDNVYIMPGATTLLSKTPSEYQIAFYENVSGSYQITNAQTEDTYDFKYASTGITLGSDKKFFWRDSAIYIHSAADSYMDLVADGAVRVSDTDPVFILWNTTHEDTDGGRESKLVWQGEQSGGELSYLAQIQASHDGTSDDEKGDLIFYTNAGSDGTSPTEALRINSSQNLLFVDDVNIGVVSDTDAIVISSSGKVNCSSGGINTIYSSGAVSGAYPTVSELNSAFGTAATVGNGFVGVIRASGSGNTWIATVAGSAWFSVAMEAAV